MGIRTTTMALAAPLLAVALLSHQPFSTLLGNTLTGRHTRHAVITPVAAPAVDPAADKDGEDDAGSWPVPSADLREPGPGWG
jgi:hypothetical protein